MQFKKEKMSDMEKKSKLSVLKDLHKQASDAMKGDLEGMKGMKKVTIASDSKSGLKEGLDKAEEMLGEEDEDEGEQREYDTADKSRDEQSEGFEDQQDESEPMDEIEAKIQELLALKEKLQK